MHLSTRIEKSANLPRFISMPFQVIPSSVHSRILASFLNHLLKDQIEQGEIDFLANKTLCVTVTDANISFHLSLKNNKLIYVSNGGSAYDIKVDACVYDFLQLIARQQDPDTLVFQRKLIMQGNTELGLELKNFLDALDLESQAGFEKIEALIIKSLPIYKRLFS